MMVRMLTDALDSFSEGGIVATRAVVRGQVLELDDALAAKYAKGGYAEALGKQCPPQGD